MDFIEGLPISEGKDKILVIVDRLTKYAHFMGVRKTDYAKQIAKVFCKNIYKLHGFPKVIVSDKDAKFKGNFWREFCKQIGTSLNMSVDRPFSTGGQLMCHEEMHRQMLMLSKTLILQGMFGPSTYFCNWNFHTPA